MDQHTSLDHWDTAPVPGWVLTDDAAATALADRHLYDGAEYEQWTDPAEWEDPL